jgi:homoserine/homoserine lactone efflux protein
MANWNIVSFLLVVVAVHLTPGPVMMTLGMQTMSRGLKTGFLTLLGVEIAELLLITIVIFGFVTVTPALLPAMRIFSGFAVVYLVHVAACAWFAKPNAVAHRERSGRNSILYGFAVTIGDPVSILFYSALFPQFVDWQKPVLAQFLLLAAIYGLFAIGFDTMLVLVSGRFSRLRRRKISARAKKYINAVALSFVACLVLYIEVASLLPNNNSVSSSSYASVRKQDATPGASYTHTAAGLAVLVLE